MSPDATIALVFGSMMLVIAAIGLGIRIGKR
jgi:hypothetical protein